MEVILKAPQKIGRKDYKSGAQSIPDHVFSNQKFKKLVKSGQIVVLAKGQSGQEVQAAKDAMNARKSELARQLSKKIAEAKSAGAAPHEVAEIVKPGIADAIAAKKLAKAAAAK